MGNATQKLEGRGKMKRHNSGEKLMRIRMALGKSQEDMAKKSCFSMTVISNMERGGIPRVKAIPKIAKAYKLTTKELVDMLYDQ